MHFINIINSSISSLIGFTLYLGSLVAFADNEVCEKVVVSGDIAWAPYSYMDDNGVLTGVGIELAQSLFNDLDIPVTVKLVQRPIDLGYMLRTGEVDLIVGTYDLPENKYVVQLLTPSYFDDIVSVVVPAGKNFAFDSWYDLQGKQGVAITAGKLSNKFNNFAAENLFVKPSDDLKFVLKKLGKRQIDYAIGSQKTLEAGINELKLKQDLEFIKNLVDKEAVFLAFSKKSPCQKFAPYLSKKLQKMRKDGEIEALMQKYTGTNSPAIASKSEESTTK